MIVRSFAIAIYASFALGCTAPVSDAADAETHLKAVFQEALDKATLVPGIVNAGAAVLIPSRGVDWRGGAGLSDPGSGKKMTGGEYVRVASTTKAFAATVMLQLAEEGVLQLDAPVTSILEDEDIPGAYGIADLYVLNGEKLGHTLTFRHLLSHTSGLGDDIFARPKDGSPSIVETYAAALSDGNADDLPLKLWSVSGLLKYFLNSGIAGQPAFPIGQGYAYSDTNYQILALVLEKATGKTVSVLYTERIFVPLGLEGIFVEKTDVDQDADKIAHHFWIVDPDTRINTDVTDLGSLVSLDFASGTAGGIAAQPDNLARFIQVLISGRLFDRPETIKEMSLPSPQSLTGDHPDSFHPVYGLGLATITLPSGRQVIGHCGFWGTCMVYWPEGDVSLAATVNQVTEGHGALRLLIDDLLSAIEASKPE